MQLLFDFIPLIAFFVAYRLFDLYVATATLMVAMVFVVAYQWLRHRKVSNILVASTVLVLVFGGITLVLRNPVFIQWKVTVVNWTVAVAFLASQLFSAQTLTQRTMGHALELAPAQWRYLNTSWVVTFAAIGAINLFVMYNYDQATWVTFKVWGQMGLLLVTVVVQAIDLAAHAAGRSRQERVALCCTFHYP
jgi:intracellular septation protein